MENNYKKELKHKWYIAHKPEILRRSKEWRNKNRKQYNELQKKWNNNNRIKKRKIAVESCKRHPETHKRNNYKYKENYPEIFLAQKIARMMLMDDKCSFVNCNSTKNLQRAHLNYDIPYLFVTLCEKHHKFIDGKYKED